MVGIVCWLAGWRTAYQYGEGLFWAGAAAIVIGVSSLLGTWGITCIPEYQYGQTVGEQRIQEHIRQDMKDTVRSHGFFILMATVGIVCIVAGALIQAIGG